MTTIEQNKAVARRWFGEGWGGKPQIADEIFAPDFTLNGVKVGPDGPKANVGVIQTGFSDIRVEIEELIGVADKVVTRYTAYGTHTGTFNGIPATNKAVAIGGIVIWRFENGQVVEDYTQFDQFAMLQQLGVIKQ